jgi:hypothetical protein
MDVGPIAGCGLEWSLARRVTTPVGDVWVIPGNGYVGLWVGGGTCARTEVVARQGLLTWTSLQSGLQGIVHGLVPDGVVEVKLIARTGASTTAFVCDNVFGALLDGPLESGASQDRLEQRTSGSADSGPLRRLSRDVLDALLPTPLLGRSTGSVRPTAPSGYIQCCRSSIKGGSVG